MLKAMTNLNLYKVPATKIREQRKIFYDLQRDDDESMELWLNRVEGVTNRCEFPVFAKFMLIDKFACELSDDEIEMIIQNDVRRRTWTYKQVREYVLNCKNEKPKDKQSIECNEKTTDNDEADSLPIEDPPKDDAPKDDPPKHDPPKHEKIPVNLSIVKPEPVRVERFLMCEIFLLKYNLNFFVHSVNFFSRLMTMRINCWMK